MPIRVPLRSKRRRVHVKKSMRAPQASSVSATSRLEELLGSANRIEELSDADDYEDMDTITGQPTLSPGQLHVNRVTSPLRDKLVTDTSEVQDQTLEVILPFLEGNPNNFKLNSHGIPQLQRPKHVDFLRDGIEQYPHQFSILDASRPWLAYWSLQGLTALGSDISEYKTRLVLRYHCHLPQQYFKFLI